MSHQHEWTYIKAGEGSYDLFGWKFGWEFYYTRECYCGTKQDAKGAGRLPKEALI